MQDLASINRVRRLYTLGRFNEAIILCTHLLKEARGSYVLWNLLGACYTAVGHSQKGLTCFLQAVALNPNYAEAHNNCGAVLKDLGELSEAEVHYKHAIAINEEFPDAHTNLGALFHEMGDSEGAIKHYSIAISLRPEHATAYYNLGNVRRSQGKTKLAIEAYENALKFKSDYISAYNNLGVCLQEDGDIAAAINAYHKALAIDPKSLSVHNNLGSALKDMGRYKDALKFYKFVSSANPCDASAHHNIGVVLQAMGDNKGSILAYKKALKLKPDYISAAVKMLHQKQHICDFSVEKKIIDWASKLVECSDPVTPFSVLSWRDCPDFQLAIARKYACHYFKGDVSSSFLTRPRLNRRIKVGYFSADFHDHATLFLMNGLFRKHDRNGFEIYCYSYGVRKNGEKRSEVEGLVDKFFDVAELSDHEIADLARAHDLHIGIDLKGYTTHSRSKIFQRRVAPIQVNYLGYPGSLGSRCFDYIVADSTVIPKETRYCYDERVLFLPHCYQPNDDLRPIAKNKLSRAHYGLREDQLVLCCFNASYKISSVEFDIWMRVLNKIPNAVLWLLRSNEMAVENLKYEASKRGINASRLVFASRVSHSEHLARQNHADIFVDTFNVNAHTTASDALWGGLPVVTKCGKQFAARVASSLLHAVGLPELIAKNDVEYENLILDLCNYPQKLQAIKWRLRQNTRNWPLFDTRRYARNLERGMLEMYVQHAKGLPPRDIWVVDDESD